MPKPFIRILIVAAVAALALIGLVVRESMARASGAEALLAIEAIDPRALLSGHYVMVMPAERTAPEAPCPTQQGEWIGLSPNGETVAGGRVYSLSSSAPTREETNLLPETLPVRGSFTCNPGSPPSEGIEGFPGSVRLHLGIDRFHINQAEAERVERVLREQRPGEETRAYAIVSVGRDGRARLKGLIVDGERLELSWS